MTQNLRPIRRSNKGSGNLSTPPALSEFRTPAERPPPLARHAATDRSSIEPDREGLGTKHALGPTASLPSGEAHQGLAAGADGLRQEVRPGWQPTTAFVACSAPGGLPMLPISRLERLPARLHELILGSAGLSLSPFALGPFSSRQHHPLSRFGCESSHCAYNRRDLTPSGNHLGGVASVLERMSVSPARGLVLFGCHSSLVRNVTAS